jgi:FGGY family of carbohydrate kinases, N-terminal domain
MTASLLAIDVGTTRINFGVLDDDGTYRLVHSADGQTVFPEPGAAIQEPDRVMRACIDALKQCAAATRRPAGLVLTGQMDGAIIVDERGAALTEWITAMDSRCRDSSRAAESRIRRISTSAPFQAGRIHWIQQSGTLPESCRALLLPAYVATVGRVWPTPSRCVGTMNLPRRRMGGRNDWTARRLSIWLMANVTGLPLWRVDADQLEFTLVGANLFVARGLGMGTDGRIPARRDNQPGNARSGAIKEPLATLSAGAPDASCVERDRHVKLLDGNTWPMS